MTDLRIDMVEEPVDEGDKEFLYTNHLHIAEPEGHQNPAIKGSYFFRTYGLPNDYHEIVRCSLREELRHLSLANS